MRTNLVLVWAAIVILACASFYAVLQASHSQAHQNDALQSIFCYINRQEQSAKSRTPAEKTAQAAEINKLLRVGGLKPCP